MRPQSKHFLARSSRARVRRANVLLELLEHGLENVIPWSPYPRLAIGPDQRIASKGSWVGEVREGRVAWQWQALP